MNKDLRTNEYEKIIKAGTDGSKFTDAIFTPGGMLQMMSRDNDATETPEDDFVENAL